MLTCTVPAGWLQLMLIVLKVIGTPTVPEIELRVGCKRA